MMVFISGGAKNGKSYFAQKLTKEMSEEHKVPLYYIATMIPGDEEDEARIKRHIKDREGWGFTTLEVPRNISSSLEDEGVNPKGAFLLDSVTATLANEMFRDGEFFSDAAERVASDLLLFGSKTGNVVYVSDYIYNDFPGEDKYTEAYRKGLAYVDRKLAEACHQVIEITAGVPIIHKG
ncbi:MAG: bifunctional adenosylcobinamide kinase/adenosylcobinamide-phosphate guanylyltransferase [Firmicutes bacterium]|nr:bifunctional adenosylcobinamide kinase/adenosylcobinamide-phosphate guanylyltransferase [Bacillota bacterium]